MLVPSLSRTGSSVAIFCTYVKYNTNPIVNQYITKYMPRINKKVIQILRFPSGTWNTLFFKFPPVHVTPNKIIKIVNHHLF
jgi:hypothetical protein